MTTSEHEPPKRRRDSNALTARRFRTPRTIVALMLREMSTTYGRSPGGYLWTILEPVGGIALFTLVMTLGLRIRTPMLGINFPLFYATGILTLMLYQRGSGVVASAITFSSALLSYPGVTYLDAILARFFVNLLTYLVISYLVFGGILLLFETRAILDVPSIMLALGLAALLGLGVGSLNAYLFPTFPLWDTVWGILTFPLFLLSTVIFTYESLPPDGQAILWYNPLVHIIGIMRRGFYPTYDAVWASPMYVVGFSLVFLVAGLFLLRRYHRDIMNR
ncbi:ABC transporter permease [Paracoccaceae bacterium Fryx2]|nr:ABC transporter permease [Paracoccaceae bacterium Fryx2]